MIWRLERRVEIEMFLEQKAVGFVVTWLLIDLEKDLTFYLVTWLFGHFISCYREEMLLGYLVTWLLGYLNSCHQEEICYLATWLLEILSYLREKRELVAW